ncbi:MAG: hypothetical protein HC900_10820 [Methylacidiphilales bacterium]|nr:hypothetical protein [Candidatus Methylacidiphilales bacterium]
MTKGGTVTLSTYYSDPQSQAGKRDVIVQSGAVINVAGGSVTYTGGDVPYTLLTAANGRRYTMANADPDVTYVAIGDAAQTRSHARWGVTETWTNRLRGQETRYESGYREGRDAGGIAILTVNPVIEGDLLFGSTAGARQIASGKETSGTARSGLPPGTIP